MVYKSSPRGSRPVSLLAVHTAEGARTARSLAAYFYRDDIQASSHDAIDGHETIPMVPYHRASWTLRSGNPISENVELCGFARWTRGQWLSTGVVDGVGNPRAMLARLADWIVVRARARSIPTRKLTVTQLGAGWWGVIAHDDWTRAKNDGTHWDPGPGFPWDFVMALVNSSDDEEDFMSALTDSQQKDLFHRINVHLPTWIEQVKADIAELRSYVRPGDTWMVRDGWLQGALSNTNTQLPAAREDIAELSAKVDQVSAAVEKLAATVAQLANPNL